MPEPAPILVTGAASGIGAATVAALRAGGATVLGLDRPGSGAELEVDLAAADAAERVSAAAPARLGGLIHVAGLPGTHAPERILAVNLLAPRALSLALVERIAPGGAVIYVASVAAGRCALEVDPLLERGDAELAAWLENSGLNGSDTYDFTKKALVALAVRHAGQWLGRGVRALSVSPGPTETPILADFVATMGAERIQGAAQIVGRNGRPQDSAAAIAFLAGGDAAWINAVDLRVDGGLIGIRSTR